MVATTFCHILDRRQLQRDRRQNNGMQRSGGGAVFGEINVNSRRPLILDVRRLKNPEVSYFDDHCFHIDQEERSQRIFVDVVQTF